MLDFSSSLYLGLNHATQQLDSWHSLTLGKPTSLEPTADYDELTRELEQLTGTKNMMLGTSTVQLLFDFAIWLQKKSVTFFLDEDCYPIAKKVFIAVNHIGRTKILRHYDPGDLVRGLRSRLNPNKRPVLVIDGYSQVKGEICPLLQYCEVLERHHGILIIDDTQLLGVYGQDAQLDLPYGRGGGGAVKAIDCSYKNIIYVSSMAKGFGVPAAFLSTTGWNISDFLNQSLIINHCSPVSNAHSAAIKHALWINGNYGEQIREKIYKLVFQFKRRLAKVGIGTIGGNFPYQTVPSNYGLSAQKLYMYLQHKGIKTVLHEFKSSNTTAISFLITARHNLNDIYSVTSLIIGYMDMTCSRNRSRGNHALSYPLR